MGTRGEATAAAPLRRVVAGKKGGVKQADLLARPDSAWPSHLAQDKIGQDKICHFSAPPSLHLRNEKGDRDTKATRDPVYLCLAPSRSTTQGSCWEMFFKKYLWVESFWATRHQK